MCAPEEKVWPIPDSSTKFLSPQNEKKLKFLWAKNINLGKEYTLEFSYLTIGWLK